MPLAILGILVASAVAMFEGHLKTITGNSSVAQIGYILLGAGFVSAGWSSRKRHAYIQPCPGQGRLVSGGRLPGLPLS